MVTDIKIDVHMIVSWNEPYICQTLQSLCHAPINLHIVPHLTGDIARARTNGFMMGNCEYVSFVDPDDIVIFGTFQRCLKVLEADKSLAGVYTDEVLIDSNNRVIMEGWSVDPKPFYKHGYEDRLMGGIHHLRVLRRDYVEKCLPLKTKRLPEPVLMAEIQKYGKLHHLKQIGYFWRIHDGQVFQSYTDEEKAEAVEIIRGFGK